MYPIQKHLPSHFLSAENPWTVTHCPGSDHILFETLSCNRFVRWQLIRKVTAEKKTGIFGSQH